MVKLPPFQKLWDAYPNAHSPADVGKLIGGAVGSGIGEVDENGVPKGWIKNTCAIRLSRAFNYSGNEFRVPSSVTFADKGNPKTMSTILGSDKLRYAFRVAEFLKYLRQSLGKPQISVAKARGDATGHLDLWDGAACKHAAYWEQAMNVYLYADKSLWTVTAPTAGAAAGTTPVVHVAPH